ncbi:MAG: SDR family NAD(P)-dependent oxidoreductase [Acidimicrobiales bacterium]
MGRLDNTVSLVTGGASGIGAACAARFAAEGATVVTADIAGTPDHVLDVTDEAAVSAAVDAIVAQHGRLDSVVNAAGVAGGGPAHLVPLEEWERVIAINLTGTFLVAKHALRPMLEQGSGSIINIASIEGIEGTEGGSAYNASKAGVIMFTKNLAIDYGRAGVRANAICPGFIETPLLNAVMDLPEMTKARETIRDHHKLGRFGQPSEIAGAALFLASEDSSFVTGHALVVDGGFTAGLRPGVLEAFGL